MRRITVDLGERSYEVVVGGGALAELGAMLSTIGSVQRVAVVSQQNVVSQEWFASIDTVMPSELFVVEDGEAAKSMNSVELLCRGFARAGLGRHDAVVGVGGGVVTDLSGYAASAYLRGVAYVNVATSLLAQVDAAIGGKTGVNIPEGKNLVGAFWQPSGVICDITTLSTLPEREWGCGHAEMAKYALLDTARSSALGTDRALMDQIAECVTMKSEIVSVDEHESRRRAVLNYGHTLAHALEAMDLANRAEADPEPNQEVPLIAHGEAVAVGLVFAALLARHMGRIDSDRVEQHRRIVEGFGLATSLPTFALERGTELVEYMRRDKKATHDLTFVLDGPRGVELVRGVELSYVIASLEEMGVRM